MEILHKKISKKGNVIYKNENIKIKNKDINVFSTGGVRAKGYFKNNENFFETCNGFIQGGSQVPLIFLQVLKGEETIYINTI